MVLGDLFIAAAIGTQRFAKRQMNINTDPIGSILFVELVCKLLFPSFNADLVLPEWNSRVAGIPGQRLIVLSYQDRVDTFNFHNCKF